MENQKTTNQNKSTIMGKIRNVFLLALPFVSGSRVSDDWKNGTYNGQKPFDVINTNKYTLQGNNILFDYKQDEGIHVKQEQIESQYLSQHEQFIATEDFFKNNVGNTYNVLGNMYQEYKFDKNGNFTS